MCVFQAARYQKLKDMRKIDMTPEQKRELAALQRNQRDARHSGTTSGVAGCSDVVSKKMSEGELEAYLNR